MQFSLGFSPNSAKGGVTGMCIKRSHRSYKSITILLPTEAQLDPNVMSFKLSVHDVLFIDNNLEQRERYNCPHCQYLLKDAVQTSCGHWFCLECAKDMFEKKYVRERESISINFMLKLHVII